MTPDELDNQLRSALGVETSPEQLARLERFWHAQSRAERRRRRLRGVAMAATVLVAVTVAWQSTRHADQVVAPLVEAPLPGREPTDYERLVFAVRTRKPIAPPRKALLSNDEKVKQQREAIERLGDSGDWNALPSLLESAENPDLRGDALAAIEQITGPDRLAEAAAQSRNGAVRTALYQRQLMGGSAAGIPGYLALVAHPATRNEALAAARSAGTRLPLEPLLGALDSSDKTTRLMAAMVLGDVNGPAVSAALIARVATTERAPVEAWVALLACPGPVVDQFLAEAARQPRMLGQVNNARAMWARMIP